LLATAELGPAGPEILVGTTPSVLPDAGIRPVATAADGSFVVVYSDDAAPVGYGGAPGHVRARRYDATGLPVGGTIQVSNYTPSTKHVPSVTSTPDGRFVVVWESLEQDGSDSGVFARRFDNGGNAVGTEFQVNGITAGAQASPHVASAADGSFVVVWESAGDGDDNGIFAQRYDSTGVPDGSAFQVNTYTTGPQVNPVVAMDDAGNATVAWGSGELGDTSIMAQRYDSSGAASGTEFQVSTAGGGFEQSPDADMNASGELVVVWERGGYTAKGQRFDAAGLPVGTEFEPTPPAAPFFDNISSVRAAIGAAGEFLVIWEKSTDFVVGGSGITTTLRARPYDAAVAPISDDFRCDTTRPTAIRRTGAAATVDGGFVVVWTNGITTAHEPRVLAQRLCDPSEASCDLCPGFDDGDDGDADGIPDGCDLCTSPGGLHDASVKKLYMSRDNLGKAQFRLSGEFVAGQPFSAFTPHSSGVRVVVQSADIGNVIDVTLPGGAYNGSGTEGWQTNASGTKWTYRNGLATAFPLPHNGVRTLQLKDRSAKAPNLVRFSLKGRSGDYDAFTFGDIPLSATVTFGGLAEATAGLCTEMFWAVEDCNYSMCCYETTAAKCS
jgi:hypothetical protein